MNISLKKNEALIVNRILDILSSSIMYNHAKDEYYLSGTHNIITMTLTEKNALLDALDKTNLNDL